MTDQELRTRWNSVWQPHGTGAAGDTLFDALFAAYSAPDRHYHTLAHVADCLVTLDTCRDEAEDAAAIEMALWFHDAVYDTHASDNEEQSAAWAVRAVREMGGSLSAETVARLILATKHGAAASSDRADKDARIIADIDLTILGADSERFWAYEDAIRREYAWVPDEIFRSKRAEILKGFLERNRIYQTPGFHEKYDKIARANLSASIARLSSDNY